MNHTEVETPANLAIIGGGPFGLILSSVLAPKSQRVTLWLPDPREARRLQQERIGRVRGNPYRLHENVDIALDLKFLQEGQWALLIACPSRTFEEIAADAIRRLSSAGPHYLAVMTKGLASRSTRRKYGAATFHQYVDALLKEKERADIHSAVITGPSLLAEIYAQHYSFFNVGAHDQMTADVFRTLLHSETIHTADTRDCVGVEVGGLLKNPIAIACGMAELLPASGANLQGMILSQGFREMFRFGRAMGADPSTLMGMSGLADLIATAASPNSRNRSFGMQFVRRMMSEEEPGLMERIEALVRPTAVIEREVLASTELVEGAFSLEPVLELAAEHKIRMRLYQTIFDILSRRKPPEALAGLFVTRPMSLDTGRAMQLHNQSLSQAAGASFVALLRKRIYHSVSGQRGMSERIHRQAPNILKSLERRLERARRKKLRREIEAIPRELELWRRIEKAGPDTIRDAMEELIEYYADEIADNFRPAVRAALIRTIAPIRFMAGGMHGGAAIPYVEGEVESLKSMGARYNILYAPTHRSHLDSVEIALGLSWNGLPVPRYAAGINLMTQPFWAGILKAMGAYAVDRERIRNFLYLECLTGYSQMMLEAGIPSLVYPEGTRSRSGGICAIKTGLLSTAIDAYRSSGAEILIVPLALSYENVPEDREFAGVSEKSEMRDFVRGRTRCYMEVCAPIRVSHFIDREDPAQAIAGEIQSSWARRLKRLPNQVVARVICESEGEVAVSRLRDLCADFLQSRPANYLNRDASSTARQGLAMLKKRGVIKERSGAIVVTHPQMLRYYAEMAPATPEF
ncbi:MAG: 1-acyl-sn-glycerol-3-phosphate acyltransferase [Leptospirales bacterium]|nr:1-acyl-sn-glycerol-3-phosphate acyltransferase [Leptospirales bacterium]